MANYRKDNVQFVDTSAALPAVQICGIKYIGASTGSVNIRADQSVSGSILWTESGTANVFNHVEISAQGGVYVECANSAAVYLYYK